MNANANKKSSARINLYKSLQKLWNAVFDEGASGLLGPAQLLREHRDRLAVRRHELDHIKMAEMELKAVQKGEKSIDDSGHISDTPRYGDDKIKLNSIIECDTVCADDIELRLGANMLLTHISHEVRLRELQRSLHIRKIAIFAEQQACNLFKGYCSDRLIDSDWAARWREYARDTYNEQVQRLWGRVLATEVFNPGSISIYTLDFIRHLAAKDVELITIAAQLCFDDFIYREAKEYFTVGIHGVMFETLEELGLVRGVKRGDLWKDIGVASATHQHVSAMLKCRNKALFVEVKYPDQDLHLPIFSLTSLGKEVMSVIQADADMAYLWAVANDLKNKGCHVQLGEWNEGKGMETFQEMMSV